MSMTPVELLQRYWDGDLPVKVENIAKAAGLRVRHALGRIENKYSGCIERMDDGVYQINVDLTESPLRQRFTIAHELGHWALGHLDDRTTCFRDGPADFSSNAMQPLEREANNFAAQLLMPDTLVKYVIDHQGVNSLADLANVFSVSQTAMSYRLRNLGLVNA
ncbi:ImmA/IrrE family metallo-endopeptidase [Aquitalea sp.]|uniref:ImmA/IrrE family metallo-endopeptidase n=1 Tax=Aquitalea sp. TaxID=1872623 RepID=UPI002585E7FA|nr:ImmA/IrrE family metallo-endopeptidase [Aquitalea sp.]